MEVKGKSTRGIRPVPVLIELVVKSAIDKLLVSRPPTSPESDYLFARYERLQHQIYPFSTFVLIFCNSEQQSS